MTVARLSMSTAHHRPQGIDGAVLRLGMSLVAWAHARTLRHDERLRRQRAHGALSHRAQVEAEHERALAQASLLRML